MGFNGRFIMNIAHYAANLGADLNELINITGLSAATLCDENCKVESSVYNAVLEKAIEKTGDTFFGLHSGEQLNLAAAGLIGQITHTCANVKEALDYCCQFANLGCSSLPTTLIEEETFFKLTLTPEKLWLRQSPESVKQTIDGYLAFTIKEFHSLTRNNYHPLAIHLTALQPNDISEYRRVLGCDMLFNQKENAILFEKKHVLEPVVTSDYNLLRILVSHAEEKMASLNNEEGFFNIVKQSIINLVRPEFPTIEQVAGHLNVSTRTLQRKLKKEGHTYKELIESLKHEFAISYLKKPELSINEIAYLLSYSSASTFIRSFKKQTGKSPNNFRSGLKKRST